MAGKMAGAGPAAGSVAVAGDPAAAAAQCAVPRSFPESVQDALLRRFVGWAILLITSGYTFLDYWNYSRTWHEGGGTEWDALLAGRGFAPAQYRIGVMRVAALLASLTHTHVRHMFAAVDCVCLGTSLLLLFRLLMRSGAFAAAERPGGGLQAGPALVVLAALGATVRADAMVAFHAGFLMTCLLAQGDDLPLGRRFQIVASAASLLAAVGVEYCIVHVLYPHAPREVSAFQLLTNLKTPADYLVLVVSLFPWWLTLRLAARRWRALDGWSLAL